MISIYCACYVIGSIWWLQYSNTVRYINGLIQCSDGDSRKTNMSGLLGIWDTNNCNENPLKTFTYWDMQLWISSISVYTPDLSCYNVSHKEILMIDYSDSDTFRKPFTIKKIDR